MLPTGRWSPCPELSAEGEGRQREGCSPGMKGFWEGVPWQKIAPAPSPHQAAGAESEGRGSSVRDGRGAVAGGCSPAPLLPAARATPLPSRQLPQGRAPLQTLLPRQLPGALPISLLSQQTTPVAVTQINSNPLDLSGKRAALTCHKSPGRQERRPAPTPSSPRPAAHLPRSLVSR